ncbi:MAG: hypothetical protein ACKOUR_14270, partial [Planctomycetota bacterium]
PLDPKLFPSSRDDDPGPSIEPSSRSWNSFPSSTASAWTHPAQNKSALNKSALNKSALNNPR